MLAAQSRLLFQLNKFYNDRVQTRKIGISKTVREITKIVMEVLREVEVQEPRFISSLAEINGRYEGKFASPKTKTHDKRQNTTVQNTLILRHLSSSTFPRVSKWASKGMSGLRDQSEQFGSSQWVSGASVRTSEWPSTYSRFMAVLNHRTRGPQKTKSDEIRTFRDDKWQQNRIMIW